MFVTRLKRSRFARLFNLPSSRPSAAKGENISHDFPFTGPIPRIIAIFNPEDGKLIMNCPGCAMTRWPDGHPPAARRVFRYVPFYLLSPSAYPPWTLKSHYTTVDATNYIHYHLLTFICFAFSLLSPVEHLSRVRIYTHTYILTQR